MQAPETMSNPSSLFSLEHYLITCQERVNARLEYWLDQQRQLAPRLLESMRYATFNGGKRVRPVLCFAAAEAVGAQAEDALDVAAALEMVHSYSLVHDDLPAMDNDELRRGKPTCHIAFDEATAILAGDALQCLAFEALATSPLESMTPAVKLRAVTLLAKASGIGGMAGGQALDLEAEGKQLDLKALETIHKHKTGCLISASVEMGALMASEASPQQLADLRRYAQAIGLAFQVQDDILDEIGDTSTLGKQQGADRELAKATYPSLMGLDQAQQLAHQLCQQAIEALAEFDEKARPLRTLAEFIVSRTH